METFLIRALQLIMSLSLLVIVHEGGHFLFARLFKTRVEKFCLFFDPWFTLFKFKPKNSDTEYGIGWLPLGGYVKIAGMIDESMDTEQMQQPMQPWEFRAKPAWQRLLIMVGGVLFNFILALFIYSMILFTWGDEYVPVQKAPLGMEFNETAKAIGFRDGDVLISADGVPFERYGGDMLTSVVDARQVTVRRDGKNIAYFDFKEEMLRRQKADSASHYITLTYARAGVIDTITFATDSIYEIGVVVRTATNQLLPVVKKEYSFLASFPAGAALGVQTLKGYVGQMKYLFSKEGAKQLGGFGTIGSIFPATWDWHQFWYMTAFLSIILAFMNILPIPALDGGHVLFLIYEIVARRKPSDKFMERAQMVGMFLLFGLLLWANFNDILRFLF